MRLRGRGSKRRHPYMINISGILPPMITPFKKNGDVDYDAFTRNIELWNKTSLSGYLVLGSNSETPYLNEGEKLQLIELTVKSAGQGKIVFAGTGLESTRDTIKLTNKAAKLGVPSALVLTPSFYGGQMTTRSLINYFTAIADAAEIPILIYNVPKFTHVNISAEAVSELSRHPKIIGMKDSKGDVAQLEIFKKVVPENFNLIVGTASALYPALELGIKAGILALANCLPEKCVELHELFKKDQKEQAKKLQAQLVPVNKAVTETFGIAGLKYASTLMGYAGGAVRSPLLPLTDKEESDIRSIMHQTNLEFNS